MVAPLPFLPRSRQQNSFVKRNSIAIANTCTRNGNQCFDRPETGRGCQDKSCSGASIKWLKIWFDLMISSWVSEGIARGFHFCGSAHSCTFGFIVMSGGTFAANSDVRVIHSTYCCPDTYVFYCIHPKVHTYSTSTSDWVFR